MNLNYKKYVVEKLFEIQDDIKLSDFNFEIEEEQDFVKRKDYNENTIYVVIKYLSDDKQIGANTQPVQFLILTEQDSLEIAKLLFSTFASKYNWKVEITDGEYVKQQYTEPVVLSNFNPVLYGYRSVLYMTATLTIIENVLDVRQVILDKDTEDEQILDCIAFNLSYSMQTNTQQTKDEKIAHSVKTVSSLTVSFTIPFQSGNIVNRFINILRENADGNNSFNLTFVIGNLEPITKNYRLVSAQLNTAINQVPGLQLGFMK